MAITNDITDKNHVKNAISKKLLMTDENNVSIIIAQIINIDACINISNLTIKSILI